MVTPFSIPLFYRDAKKLINILKKLNVQDIISLMEISPKLAELNVIRYKQFKIPFTTENAKQAIFLFSGDVYQTLKASELKDEDIYFANDHLRILSGLYGLLKPLDLIQAYRLEMGIQLAHAKGNNLYSFWGNKITKEINKHFNTGNSSVLINLASKEYALSIDFKKIKAKVITPHFREFRNGKLMFLSFNAKKARGLMTRYIIENRISSPEELKLFNIAGYYFDEKLSSADEWFFMR